MVSQTSKKRALESLTSLPVLTSSGMEMTEANEEFLISMEIWLAKGGRIILIPWAVYYRASPYSGENPKQGSLPTVFLAHFQGPPL